MTLRWKTENSAESLHSQSSAQWFRFLLFKILILDATRAKSLGISFKQTPCVYHLSLSKYTLTYLCFKSQQYWIL